MADITILSRFVAGVVRNTNIQENTLVVGSLKVGATSPLELTKAILDRLLKTQDGSDLDATYHTHDGRYFTESELGSTTNGSSGASKIGIDQTPAFSNFIPTAATVQGALEGIDGALSASGKDEFSDALFRIKDNSDPTKKIALEASGISTGTVRTITMPDADVDLGSLTNSNISSTAAIVESKLSLDYSTSSLNTAISGKVSKSGDSMSSAANLTFSGGGEVLGLPSTPSAAGAAASKAYVDAVALGLSPKKGVRVATTASITLSGAQTIDGVSVVAGDRVLVKDQSSASANGIYVAASGSWSRATDFDSLSPIDEVNGAWVPVQLGTVNAGKVFVQYGLVSSLGVDDINFESYNPLASLSGGDMVTVSGSNVTLDLATDAGLESSNPGDAAGQLRVKLNGATIDRSSSGIKVADGGISNAQVSASAAIAYSKLSLSNSIVAGDLASNSVTSAKIGSGAVDENKLAASVAGAGLTGGGGSALAVGAGDASISVAADAISVARDAAGAIGLSGTGVKANVDGTTIQISGNNLAVKADGIRDLYATFTNNTGSSIAAGSIVVASQSVAGEIVLADADGLSTCEGVLGMVVSTIASGASGKVQIAGRCAPTQDASFDLGKRVYVSTTAGSTTKTAPSTTNSVIYLMGIAVSTTEIMLGMQLVAINE